VSTVGAGPDASNEVGETLRYARQRAGLTLGELAARIGISAATLSRVETGKVRLREDRLEQCGIELQIDILELSRKISSGDVDALDDNLDESTPGTYVPDGPGAWRRYDPLVLDPGLQSALDSFLELGYHGTSVRDIARRAGLSVPGLYHHYPRKEDLLVAVMDLTMNDFYARCAAARAEGEDATSRFRLLVECFALYHAYRHQLSFIGASEMRSLEPAQRRRIADIRTTCQRMVTDEVVAMELEGLLRSEVPDDAARAVVTMLVGIHNWYRPDGPLPPEEIARRYVDHALALVGFHDHH
jgi:TetR/AcrR family transcriptional regulator, cholesterol catabolism regulator